MVNHRFWANVLRRLVVTGVVPNPAGLRDCPANLSALSIVSYIRTVFADRRVCLLIAFTLLVACSSDTTGAASTAVEPSLQTRALAIPGPTALIQEPVSAPVADSPAAQQNAESATAAPASADDFESWSTEQDADATTPTFTVSPEPEPRCVRFTDFAVDAENLSWFIVNDVVMGGRSSGGPTFADSVMLFEGEINTDGGGFSSVRVRLGVNALAGFTELVVRARTDGRAYKLILEDGLASRDRRVSQQGSIDFADTTDWQTVRVPFADLDPKIFGRAVNTEAFRPDLATQLGVMISDGADGPFRIEIDWIDACS